MPPKKTSKTIQKNNNKQASVPATKKPNERTPSSSLINIILHIVVYVAVIAIIVRSDYFADILYHVLGIVGNTVRIINPDSFWISEMYYVRCVTRVLRPYSMSSSVIDNYYSNDYVKTIFFSVFCVQDFLFALAGAAQFFAFSRSYIVVTLLREVAFVRCFFQIYFGYLVGDWVLVSGNVCDAASRNGFILVMLSGNVLSGPVVAALGGIASLQKLSYLLL